MKILFISRAYPPVTGGIENQNYELSKWLPSCAQVKTIANKKGKKFLPLFMPYACIKALFLLRRFDALLLGDGVLGVTGFFIKLFYKNKPVVCIVHGLDLTFQSFIYQKLWVNIFLRKVDNYIAVGNETVKIAEEKGFSSSKISFIPNGVDPEKFLHEGYTRDDLANILNENLSEKHIILTAGRLARRKGVAWFIENVMPKLPQNIIYVVSGDGPDRENIVKTIKEADLKERVKLLGYVSDEKRNILLNTCDLFIQPNIKVKGDVEGFGIAVIEAAAARRVLIASKLEGLQDAIKDGENGFLLESENAQEFTIKIKDLLENETFRQEFGIKARQYVVDNYHWKKVSALYCDKISEAIKQKKC